MAQVFQSQIMNYLGDVMHSYQQIDLAILNHLKETGSQGTTNIIRSLSFKKNDIEKSLMRLKETNGITAARSNGGNSKSTTWHLVVNKNSYRYKLILNKWNKQDLLVLNK